MNRPSFPRHTLPTAFETSRRRKKSDDFSPICGLSPGFTADQEEGITSNRRSLDIHFEIHHSSFDIQRFKKMQKHPLIPKLLSRSDNRRARRNNPEATGYLDSRQLGGTRMASTSPLAHSWLPLSTEHESLFFFPSVSRIRARRVTGVSIGTGRT
jgi:hypothetical protein